MAGSSPLGIYLCKAKNWNTKAICEIYSKLTIKTPGWRHWSSIGDCPSNNKVRLESFTPHLRQFLFLVTRLLHVLKYQQVYPRQTAPPFSLYSLTLQKPPYSLTYSSFHCLLNIKVKTDQCFIFFSHPVFSKIFSWIIFEFEKISKSYFILRKRGCETN